MKYLIVSVTIACMVNIRVFSQEILTLEACKNLAIENHEKVKIAANSIESAKANTKATERDFYPTISAQGDYTYLADPVSILLEGTEYLGATNLYNISAVLAQNVYSGGMVRLQTENARIEEMIAGDNLDLTKDELLYHTELYYWKASYAQESNNIAIQYKSLLDELVQVVADKVGTGLVPKNDLLMTEVKQNEAELMIYKTRMQHAVALMELNRIIGYEIDSEVNVSSSDIYQNYATPELQAFDNVLEDRPEVSIQQSKINISENNIGLVKSKYLPKVNLNLQPIWGAPNTDLLNPDPIFNAAFFVSVSMPLVQWGKKHYEVSEQQFGYESSLLAMEDLRKQISLEVSSSYYKLQEAESRIALTEASLGKARENYELVEDRYREGLSPIIEVLEAQYSWLLAYNSVLDSRWNYFMAQAEYNKVIGNM